MAYNLYKFQAEAVQLAAQRNLLLIHDAGLGKTVTAASLIRKLHPIIVGRLGSCSTLILTKKILIKQWYMALHNQLDWTLPTEIPKNPRPALLFSPHNPDVKIAITNYQYLAKMQDVTFDIVIFDEMHLVRNPKTKLWTQVKRIRARRMLGLTATPFESKPWQIMPLLHLLHPREFPLRLTNHFKSLLEDAEEKHLNRRLQMFANASSNYVHCVQTKDVAVNDVQVRAEIVTLPMDSSARKMYLKMSEEIDIVCRVKGGVFALENELAKNILLRQLSTYPPLINGKSLNAKQVFFADSSAYPKIQWVLELVRTARTDKILIMTAFRRVAQLISNALNVKVNTAHEGITVGTFAALSTGVDMPDHQILVMVDLVYSNTVLRQAKSRILRMNSKGEKTLYFLLASEIDRQMFSTFVQKSKLNEVVHTLLQ